MKSLTKCVMTAAMTLSAISLVYAQETQATDDHKTHHAPADQQTTKSATQQGNGVDGEMVNGEVKKVNKEAGKITIRHEELKDLGMPPMTMVFQVKESIMLDQVKVGDKIRFQAEKAGGAFTLTKLDIQK